jgi:hypothetical protein
MLGCRTLEHYRTPATARRPRRGPQEQAGGVELAVQSSFDEKRKVVEDLQLAELKD